MSIRKYLKSLRKHNSKLYLIYYQLARKNDFILTANVLQFASKIIIITEEGIQKHKSKQFITFPLPQTAR